MTEVAINFMRRRQRGIILTLANFSAILNWAITVLNIGITIGKGLTKLGKIFIWGDKSLRGSASNRIMPY